MPLERTPVRRILASLEKQFPALVLERGVAVVLFLSLECICGDTIWLGMVVSVDINSAPVNPIRG